MTLTENLSTIDSLKKELEQLPPLSKEAEHKLWQKFRLEWNYNSNHIEGNTLTYGETQLLLIFDKTTGSHELREYEEMRAHDVAIHAVKDWTKENSRQLSEYDIKNLNEIILVRPYYKEAMTYDGQATRRLIKVGEYKEHPNSVRLKNGELFHYASPSGTPKLMKELIDWFRANEKENPIILAAELHYRFIRVHPFDDGNGRVARLLVNYILMKNGLPPVIVKSSHKDSYLTALQKADSGDRIAFHNYMAEQLIWSFQIALKAAKGESIEEEDDVDKEIAVWKKQLKGTRANVMPKSDSQIYELYQRGFKQLFELHIDKMKQFDDMFASKEITGWVNGSGMNKQGIEYLDSYFQNWANTQAQSLRTGEAPSFHFDKINSISFSIHLKGFNKDGINAFEQSSEIRIEFEPFKYTVWIDTGKLKENLYTEHLSIENARSIVTQCVKHTFDAIKLKIKTA